MLKRTAELLIVLYPCFYHNTNVTYLLIHQTPDKQKALLGRDNIESIKAVVVDGLPPFV